jgi:hypothetical protein
MQTLNSRACMHILDSYHCLKSFKKLKDICINVRIDRAIPLPILVMPNTLDDIHNILERENYLIRMDKTHMPIFDYVQFINIIRMLVFRNCEGNLVQVCIS